MAVLMTQELADKMIADYQNAIDVISKISDLTAAEKWLEWNNISSGLCALSCWKHGQNLKHCAWVNSIPKLGNGYVFRPPWLCYTIPEIIEALEYRLKLLKQFPN